MTPKEKTNKTYYLMKENSWGSAVRETFHNKDDAKKELDKLNKAQSHRPHQFQLYYYIIER